MQILAVRDRSIAFLERPLKPRANKFNPKRRLLSIELAESKRTVLLELRDRVRYGGNSEHKRNPGDFGLSPSSGPRPGKTLCDEAGIFRRADALALLGSAFQRGLVSDRFDGDWPYNVWAVTRDGVPLEAQWEAEGVYHGYPMPENDPFREVVLTRWSGVRG
jgi:hypothetical protein